MIITTGGVSVGDADYIRDALLKIGPSAVTLANSEGLECHGRSIGERMKSNSE